MSMQKLSIPYFGVITKNKWYPTIASSHQLCAIRRNHFHTRVTLGRSWPYLLAHSPSFHVPPLLPIYPRPLFAIHGGGSDCSSLMPSLLHCLHNSGICSFSKCSHVCHCGGGGRAHILIRGLGESQLAPVWFGNKGTSDVGTINHYNSVICLRQMF